MTFKTIALGQAQTPVPSSRGTRPTDWLGNARAWQSEVARCRNGWMVEITNFRSRINRILKKNPSLKNYLGAEYNDIYQDATKAMKLLFEMPEDNFVQLNLIMQEDYFG